MGGSMFWLWPMCFPSSHKLPTYDQKATTTAWVLTEKWFYLYRVPKHIHSDQGRNFEGELLRQLNKIYGIEKSCTTPYHPEGNRQCEWFNWILHDLLHSLPRDKKKKWPRYLPQILFACNTIEHTSTNYSPYESMFVQRARLPVVFLLAIPDDNSAQRSTHKWVLEHEKIPGFTFRGQRSRETVRAPCTDLQLQPKF